MRPDCRVVLVATLFIAQPAFPVGDAKTVDPATPVHIRPAADGRADYLTADGVPAFTEVSAVDVDDEVDADVDASTEQVLEPIPLQIVSPGVSVRFEIVTRNVDGPVSVTVDRLPDDAAMMENADGSHSFRWLTDPDDEGEHVFRFTAVDESRSTVIDVRDATILVGDPQAGRSFPAR